MGLTACTSDATPATSTAQVQPTVAPVEPTAAPAQPTLAPAHPATTPMQATQAENSAMDGLIAAAKAESQLNVIALPHDWLNYGEMITTFSQKYSIKVNELNPHAGSGDEINAIQANQNNKDAQAPDVIDVGLYFGQQAKIDKLIQPYKVSTWDTIPNAAKDPEGYWYGDYYGALAYEINADVVKTEPQDWSDLLKPEYKGQIALVGDPKTSNQAILSIMAAGLANGGSANDVLPGIKYFDQLNKAGNFIPVIAKLDTLIQGKTPIVIRWDYLALDDRDISNGKPKIDVVIPKSGVVAGVYVQAISASAPHPNAAKLWMEFLYSDQGQLIWLKGNGHPIRYDDMIKRNVIPADLAARLPSPDLYQNAIFPSLDQQNAAAKTVNANWDTIVKVNVK
jgi:putative spermidine/putrescine transport system substrate-binding protein